MSVNLLRLFVILPCCAWSLAGVQVLDGASSFPPDSVMVSFNSGSRWFPDEFDPNRVAPSWGVSFSGTTPALSNHSAHSYVSWETLLSNPKVTGSSRPLIVDVSPARRVAVSLISFPGEENVRVKGFSPEGEELASATRVFPPLPISGLGLKATRVFLGFESTEKTIAKVTVEYTGKNGSYAEDETETLQYVLVDREGERRFTTVIPQFIQGRLGDRTFRSEIVFLNLSTSTLQGDIRFFDTAGQPLELEDYGSSISTTEIPGFGGARGIQIPGEYNPPISGYCRITSKAPVQAVLRIREFGPDDALLSEIETSATPTTIHACVVATGQRLVEAVNIESAIAIVNTSDKTAHVSLRWLEQTTVEIPPGARLARFISELFPERFPYDDEPTQFDFVERLELVSDQPVAVAVFHTANGLPIAASPVTVY